MAGGPYYGFGTTFQVAGSLTQRQLQNQQSVAPGAAPVGISPGGGPQSPTGGMSAANRPGISGPQFNPNATPMAPDLGAGRSAIVPARSANRFQGVNTESPAEMLSQWESPNAVNVDGIRLPGMIQPRLGIAKCGQSTNNTVGIGMVPLYFDVGSVAQMLLVSQVGTTLATASLQVVGVSCGVPPIRELFPTPVMSVVNNGSGNFSVRIGTMLQVGGIDSVRLAWNRRGAIPTAPFQNSVRYSDNIVSNAWYGDVSYTSGNIATGSSVACTVYVTAWVQTRLGRSQPVSVIRRVTV